jgi:Uma2 family endonuclease
MWTDVLVDRRPGVGYGESVMSATPVRTRRWKRQEYERLVGSGAFPPGERLELIAGQMVVREPQGSAHATAVDLAQDVLRAAFGPGWRVRVQSPVALDDDSEPEPDLMVVAGTARDYRRTHPARPALIVEVADTSLRFDRRHKGSLYARGGVADYWIVNLVKRVLEVRRTPAASASAPYGWQYRRVQMLGPSAVVSPLAAPSARIAVADLLP